MGADERALCGMISVTPSTGDTVYGRSLDSHMRRELEVRGASSNWADLTVSHGRPVISSHPNFRDRAS